MNFSKSEFKKLVMMCYWWELMRNSYLLHTDKEYDQECDDILDYLCEFAEENGMKDYLLEKWWKPERCNQLDFLCQPCVEDYNEFIIIDYLSYKIALQEFSDKYSRFPESHEDYNLVDDIQNTRIDKIQEQWIDNIHLQIL